MHIVYLPVYFYWIWLSIRARSLFFFNAANPGMKNGGFVMESKFDIYQLIPPLFYPATILVRSDVPLVEISKLLNAHQIDYPFFAKPDIGLRGSAVKKINDEKELEDYHERATFDYLIQNQIPYPNEIGVFYVKLPGSTGKITGIVNKELVTVTGDGYSNIEELICQIPRFELQITPLRREYGQRLLEILPLNQRMNLVPYGNHIRGAKFTDVSHWKTPQLERAFDEICSQVSGFCFGRLDIMYNTIEELEQKRNFMIVEINGAASEPTHIYDPRHSLWFAWKELLRHINLMYLVSKANRDSGAPYLNFKQGMQEIRNHFKHNAKILKF